MRFFKLFTEVGVGLGTILNGYCGTTTASHGTSVKSVCDKWNNAVDTFLYNIEYVAFINITGYGFTDTLFKARGHSHEGRVCGGVGSDESRGLAKVRRTHMVPAVIP